jgi:arsenate reductase-like glutaredoxin family protein
MPKSIAWMYHRKNCTGCQKAQKVLDRVPHTIGEKVDAGKQRLGRKEALALARSAKRVVTGRGKTPVVFDMKSDPPDDDALAAAILGRSGNLKAPTMRIGDTLLVGFNEATYRQMFGDS